MPITEPPKVAKLLERLYMVLLLTVCAAFGSEDNTIPMAEAVALLLLLALAMERSRTRFSEIVQVPVVTLIPLIEPAVAVLELLVAFTMLATVLPVILMVPDAALLIPIAIWALPVDAELTLILFEVLVLPTVLPMMVTPPVEDDLEIPQKLVLPAEPALPAVTDPTLLLRQSTVPVLAMFIPINKEFEAPAVNCMDPVPETAPMVLPVTVPTFTFGLPERFMPLKLVLVAPLFVQFMFCMVLP